MGYDIRAWLDQDGRPRLEISDSGSGELRVAWDCDGERSPALKSLFHELLLLSAREHLRRQGTRRRR